MAVEWSGLGPDILVVLDRDTAVPLRTQPWHTFPVEPASAP